MLKYLLFAKFVILRLKISNSDTIIVKSVNYKKINRFKITKKVEKGKIA